MSDSIKCFEYIQRYASDFKRWPTINAQISAVPPQSFRIKLKYTSPYISINFLGLYLSLEYLFNFLSNLPWLGKKLENFGVQITRKCICVRKNVIQTLSPIPLLAKLSTRLLSSHLRYRKITHSPKTVFFLSRICFSPAESRGGNYVTQSRIYPTSFTNIHF